MVPTRVGENFCREAERVLYAYDQLPKIAHEIAETQRERFRVVVIERLAHAVAVPSVAELQTRNTQLDVKLDIEPYRSIERWVKGKQYDIAIGPAMSGQLDIDSRIFTRAPLVAVIPKDHPLTGSKTVTPSMLSNEKLALTVDGSLLRSQIDALFSNAGVHTQSAIEVSDTSLACQLAAAGHTITICDPFVAAPYLDRVCLRPIKPTTILEFALFIPEGTRSALSTSFEEILRKKAKEFLRRASIKVEPLNSV